MHKNLDHDVPAFPGLRTADLLASGVEETDEWVRRRCAASGIAIMSTTLAPKDRGQRRVALVSDGETFTGRDAIYRFAVYGE